MRDLKWIYWLAGLIEGEGTFTTYRGNMAFKIAMTDEDTLQDARDIINLGRVTGPYVYKNNLPLWHWTIARECDVAALMMTIYPIMGERRREKIEELLLAWRAKPNTNRGKGRWKHTLPKGRLN